MGIYSTTAGGSTGGSNGMYSTTAEQPPSAIDSNVNTKYLNFGGGSSSGIDSGFYVIPTISSTSIARALLFATANDVPDRDPLTVTLEGSHVSSGSALDLGTSWTLIYSGPTGIDPTVDPGRTLYVAQQSFANMVAYASYRILVTSKRGSVNCVQYAEAQIIGYI